MIKLQHNGNSQNACFKQLSVRDLLFAYYGFPEIERLKSHGNHNLISFYLKGEKNSYSEESPWRTGSEASYFYRQISHLKEMTTSEGGKVLVFHIPDKFLIQFAKEFIDDLTFENLPESTTEMGLKIHLDEVTKACFYSILPYFSLKKMPSEKLLELKFKELLLDILSNPQNKQLLAYILHLNDNLKPPIWQVMERNYTNHLNLKEYAHISSRSLASFKREFFEYYHVTPGKWLTDKRLSHARMLLINTNQSISEISLNSGFENASHFSRIYKEKFLLSPLQFRKRRNGSFRKVQQP